jgi:hypothetical protein
MAASRNPPAAYLWEPFSPLHRPGICDARFPYWFPYVSKENEHAYARSVGDMLNYRYRPGAELRTVRTPKDAARMARDWRRFVAYGRRHAVPVLKDPIAVFSAEWLVETFGAEPVVLIRHPAAFAYSMVRRGLSHPFDDFLKQPLLMRDVLGPFEADIRDFAAEPRPILEQAIVLWRIIYSVVGDYRARHAGWEFVRLEDVARDPIGVFGDLFARFGLTFDDAIRTAILASSDSSNPAEVVSASSVRRNSLASVVTWRERMAREDIERVRVGVADVAKQFYLDSDWPDSDWSDTPDRDTPDSDR